MARGDRCRRCGSTNVMVQAVAEQKKRGCFGALFWIFLSIITLGAVIWIPLLMHKDSRTRSYFVCQNCGNTWRA